MPNERTLRKTRSRTAQKPGPSRRLYADDQAETITGLLGGVLGLPIPDKLREAFNAKIRAFIRRAGVARGASLADAGPDQLSDWLSEALKKQTKKQNPVASRMQRERSARVKRKG